MTTKSTTKASATKVKADIPAKKMTRREIEFIALAIAEKAVEGERTALQARQSMFNEAMTAIMDKAVTDDMVNVLPEAYRPLREQGGISINYDASGVYHHSSICSFVLTRPVYLMQGMRWGSELPKEATSLFPDAMIQEGRVLHVATEDMKNRFRKLRDELTNNLTAARTVRNACQLWPEAADIILDKTDIAAEVEVPLAAILGRYLKMLPAPEAEGIEGQDRKSYSDDQDRESYTDVANDNAMDDTARSVGQTFDPRC